MSESCIALSCAKDAENHARVIYPPPARYWDDEQWRPIELKAGGVCREHADSPWGLITPAEWDRFAKLMRGRGVPVSRDHVRIVCRSLKTH